MRYRKFENHYFRGCSLQWLLPQRITLQPFSWITIAALVLNTGTISKTGSLLLRLIAFRATALSMWPNSELLPLFAGALPQATLRGGRSFPNRRPYTWRSLPSLTEWGGWMPQFMHGSDRASLRWPAPQTLGAQFMAILNLKLCSTRGTCQHCSKSKTIGGQPGNLGKICDKATGSTITSSRPISQPQLAR